MRCVKWIIFVVFFTFAESAPFPSKLFDDRNITKFLKSTVRNFILDIHPSLKAKNQTYNQTLGEDTLKVTIVNEGSYGELRPVANGFMIKGQIMGFMEVFLQRYGHNFVTEVFPMEGTISFIDEQNVITDERITWNSNSGIRIETFDVDHFEINLHPDDYQYKPNEEEEVKHEIRKFVKKITKKNFEAKIEHVRILMDYLGGEIITVYLKQFFLNTKERYYSIGNIPTSNYTLNNVTINGLWNVQSFTVNASNLEAFPQAEFGAVTGTMVQNFESEQKEPLELNFNASNVYIYANQTAVGQKAYVKITGYSFKNTKTNTLLEENESKSIIAEIESAFEASLSSKSHY